MSNRRVQPKKSRKVDADDFDFLASQQSTGSDDNAQQLLAVFYEQIKTSIGKEREKEKKFIATAKKHIDQDLLNPSEGVKSSLQRLDSLYAKFIPQYASSEDRIRKLWFQIWTEQQKLLILAEKRRALNVEAGKETETAQIAGMARAKEACADYSRLINAILPRHS